MPRTDSDPLGPGFQSRLRAALDRVQPRHSPPRYQTAPALRTWRLAPAALAIGVTGVLALTVFAASGNSNAAELERHIVNVIQSNPEPSPSPTPPEFKAAPVAPPQNEATPRSEPGEPAGSTERPEPEQSPSQTSTPSPEATDNPSDGPSPTPTPGDH